MEEHSKIIFSNEALVRKVWRPLESTFLSLSLVTVNSWLPVAIPRSGACSVQVEADAKKALVPEVCAGRLYSVFSPVCGGRG